MRLTTIILLSACLAASAKTGAQNITLSVKNAPLEKVFAEIKKQTGYSFVYNNSLLAKTKISLSVSGASVEQVLGLALKDQPFTFEIIDHTIIVKPRQGIPNENLSTEANNPPPLDITGKVTDSDGNPLAGATVKVKGTTHGTTTNSDGEFVLKSVDENASLEISYVGFETYSVAVNNKTTIVASLKVKPESLNEIVVNKGYYTEKQRLSTGNVSKITAKEIEKQPVNNPLLALQGRVPGLEVTQGSGVPGSAVKVRIRGQNSFVNGNEPLYIIDGVPYTSQLLPGLANILGAATVDFRGLTSYGNPLSFINPADIEAIDVLKDADATAIYGSRAANGAILITTKKGKAGKTKVDVNAYTGWGNVTRKVPILNLRQYLDMRYEAFKNDGATPDPNSDYDLTLWDTTHYTDWQKYFIGGTARYNNIQTSVSGGNSQVQYLIGAGYNKETTVFPGDFDDTKASVHFNISSSSPNQKFKISLTGSYLADNNKLLNEDLTKYIYLAPNAPQVFNADGSLNWAFDAAGSPTWDNPMLYMARKYKNSSNNLVANSIVGYEFIPGLVIKSSLGYTNLQSNEISTFPTTSINPVATINQSSSNFADNNFQSWIIEPQISYNRLIGKGKLDVLIGGTFQSNNSDGTVLTASGFTTDDLIENKNAAAIVDITSATTNQYKYNAVFAKLNYNWADKYLVNITGRRDGSSRFGPEARFHNFGAIGVGWIFSNENFIKKNLHFLSYGKLRGSYGITGNDQIGDYRYFDLYFPTGYSYQGSNGLVINNLFNPALAWEETKKLELAIELGLLNDRLVLASSYFRNKSSNQLVGYALPSTTGFQNMDANQDALVQNKGYEVQLTGTILQNKNMKWTSSINFTRTRNKVISLGPNFYGNKDIIGHSLNSFYSAHFLGVDPTTGNYQFLSKNGTPTFSPDTFYFNRDLNADFYGGFQNSLNFKGFQLDAIFQFVKQEGQNNIYGLEPGRFYSISNQPLTVLDRWQKPGDTRSIQQFSQNGSLTSSNEAIDRSDALITEASFIRLKNIAISYTIPTASKQRLPFQNCRVYVQCQNLLTITNYKGSDPENRSIYSLPPLRVITTGVQLTF